MESQTHGTPDPAAHSWRPDDIWSQVRQDFLATGDAGAVQRAVTDATAATVIEAYDASIAGLLPQSAALFAVGAFGRSELFPKSDVDILVVCQAAAREGLKEALPQFTGVLWQKGLRLNPRVCTPEECLQFRDQNIDLAINLLDSRFLAGHRKVAAELTDRLPGFLTNHGSAIARVLAQLTRARHDRHGNTPYHAEPDVKEGPGGLRDIRLLKRIERLCPDLGGPDEDLRGALSLFSAIRCFLHFRAGADRNILDQAARHDLAQAPFAFSLKEYFERAWHVFNRARAALEALETSEDGSRGAETEPDFEFKIQNGRARLNKGRDIAADPGVLSRAAQFVSLHGSPLAAETELRFEAALPAWAKFFAQPQDLWPVLRTIFTSPHPDVAIRGSRTFLMSIFPEWVEIEGLIVEDAEHRYSAAEHTLSGIARVAALRDTGDPVRQRFSDLLAEIDNVPTLLFAILLRERGTAAASAAMERVQMPAEEREITTFLIDHRNDLIKTVGGRDLGDPATARFLANQAGTIERLRLLALLSYADIAATHPESTTLWRLEQLWRTYDITRDELTRELETDRIEDVPATLPASAGFIRGFPVRYLRSRTPAEIALHTRLYELSQATGVAVQLDHTEAAHKLTIVSRDRPYLFASFAGAISSFGLDIVQAEAFSNSAGLVLDTFVFADPKRTLDLNPSEAERLEDLIRRVGLGKTDARRLLRNQAKPDASKRTIAPRVEFDSEACETATLVEIVAEDRPALLYSLANAISSTGCNIDVVLIDTKGHRAMDVFYVARDGRKLSQQVQDDLREKLIAAC